VGRLSSCALSPNNQRRRSNACHRSATRNTILVRSEGPQAVDADPQPADPEGRNVRAAGGCIIRFKGTDYTLVDPEVIDVESVLPATRTAFKRRERIMFRAIGITHLLRLRIAAN
jgi:hypothetical protein